MTCTTFALYTNNFTKSLNQALAQLDTDPSNVSMKVRWDFLIKFRTNFDHWLRVRALFLRLDGLAEQPGSHTSNP
jgi:gamma-tubulin complex component 2